MPNDELFRRVQMLTAATNRYRDVCDTDPSKTDAQRAAAAEAVWWSMRVAKWFDGTDRTLDLTYDSASGLAELEVRENGDGKI